MKVKTTLSDKLVKLFSYLFIAFVALACILPLILVLSVSFSDNTAIIKEGYSLLPRDFTLDTYIYLFAHSGKAILKSYAVTISVTMIGTMISMLITSMMAYALSIKQMKYRNVVSFICEFTVIFLPAWFLGTTSA